MGHFGPVTYYNRTLWPCDLLTIEHYGPVTYLYDGTLWPYTCNNGKTS